jgi:hypothetical protein
VLLGPREIALRVKAELEARLSDPQPAPLYPSVSEIEVDRIEVRGVEPHLDLVLFFRHGSRPGCVFAFPFKDVSGQAAEDAKGQELMTGRPPEDSDIVDWFAKLILINLDEEIAATDLGLPQDCDPSTTTWLL